MNTYLVNFQYQGDDRCENHYVAYCKTDDEEEVEDKVMSLDCCSSLEDQCRDDFREYFDNDEDFSEDDDWVGIAIENINGASYIDSDWFRNLEVIIDERNEQN